MVEETKKTRIIRLLKSDVGLRAICRIEGISNTVVYKIMDEIGMERQKAGIKHIEKVGMAVKVDEFVCPGISHCITCKHIFESVCSMG